MKRISYGTTNLEALYQIFKLDSNAELENKKARLFPTGNTETEIATTSIFLSSLSAVKEYREELLLAINVNKIKTRNVSVHAYTELNNDSKEDRPDGLLVITSGKHNPIVEWAAFLEFKVSDKKIEQSQIDRYIAFGKNIGINSIITVSNEMVTSPLDSPVQSRRGIQLCHWSWTYLKVIAAKLIRNDAVLDADHVYILKELRRYMDNHRNLKNYNHMGEGWKEAVLKIHSYEYAKKIDKTTLNTLVTAYKQEEKDISLQLMDSSPYELALAAKSDRASVIEKMLQEQKLVTTPFCINKNKAQRFYIDTDFIRQEIRCYTNVIIEKGKAQAQTTALIKMLDPENIAITDKIWIKAIYNRKKTVETEYTLNHLIDDKNYDRPYSILDKKLGDEVKIFEIKIKQSLGRNFHSPKNFIVKIEGLASVFLQQIMTNFVK